MADSDLSERCDTPSTDDPVCRFIPVPQHIRDKWPVAYCLFLVAPLELSHDDEIGMCVRDYSHENIDVPRLMGYIEQVADLVNTLDDYERLECNEDEENEYNSPFHTQTQDKIVAIRYKIHQLVEEATKARIEDEKIAFLEYQFGDIKNAADPCQ